jgi:ribosome-binding protein aMBF1 (putative translation factor)
MQAQASQAPAGEGRYPDRKAISEQFGHFLSKARQRAGLSQDGLARLASTHQRDVSRLERGEHCPRLDTVVRLLAAVGADPLELLEAIGNASE